jgi:hypothetical protein
MTMMTQEAGCEREPMGAMKVLEGCRAANMGSLIESVYDVGTRDIASRCTFTSHGF